MNVAHRDLKPANIMIDKDDYVKLIDFGEAKIVSPEEELRFTNMMSQIERKNSRSSDGQSSFFGKLRNKQSKKKPRGTFVGTPLYCAPEMLESNQSGLYSDLWALGCIIYELSTGKKMFAGKNNQAVF